MARPKKPAKTTRPKDPKLPKRSRKAGFMKNTAQGVREGGKATIKRAATAAPYGRTGAGQRLTANNNDGMPLDHEMHRYEVPKDAKAKKPKKPKIKKPGYQY